MKANSKIKQGLVVSPATRTKKVRVEINGQEMPDYQGHPVLSVEASSKFDTKDFGCLHSYYIVEDLTELKQKSPMFYKNYSVLVSARGLHITNYSPVTGIDKNVFYSACAKIFNSNLNQLRKFGFTNNPSCFHICEGQAEDIIGIVYSSGAIKHTKIKKLADNIKGFIDLLEAEATKTINNSQITSDNNS